MARRRKAGAGDEAKLELTPMIDVVFLLLIFFVIAVKQDDLLSRFDATRPGDGGGAGEMPGVRLAVTRDGFMLGGSPISRGELARRLNRVATLDPGALVLVSCDRDAHHGTMVQALDTCKQAGLSRLAVTTRAGRETR